jgi:hypothetical protein
MEYYQFVRGSGALHLFKKTLYNPCKKRALSGDQEETGSMQRYERLCRIGHPVFFYVKNPNGL